MNTKKRQTSGVQSLLVGNGINRLFSGSLSLDELELEGYSIRKEKNNIVIEYGDIIKRYEYNEYDNINFPMRMMARSLGKSEVIQKAIKEKIKSDFINEFKNEQKEFIEKLLNLDVTSILTTNYSFEFERSTIEKCSIGKIQSYYKNEVLEKDVPKYRTNELIGKLNESIEKDDKLNKKGNGSNKKKNVLNEEYDSDIHQYIELRENNKKLWHIHGIATRYKSIVLDHYAYGKLLKKIQEHTKNIIKRFTNSNYQMVSWIDYFLVGDVHILGFKFDLAEVDLWWLLSFKSRHFQFAKTYFYCMEEELEPEKKIMLQTYNVEIIDPRKSKSAPEGVINQSGNYKEFYESAIEEITRIINSRKRN